MKKFILILVLLAMSIQAEMIKNDIGIYADVQKNKIELKWIVKNYSSANVYKIYRSAKGEPEKLIGIVKPISYEKLKRDGYSEDYIFQFYPYKGAKTLDDRIRIRQIDEKINVFRIIQLAKNLQFAKNLGQYFSDPNIKKDTKYRYKIILENNGKKILQKIILVDTAYYKRNNSIKWLQGTRTNHGVLLNWDIANSSAFYDIYRKKKTQNRFQKLNQNPIFIDKSFALKHKTLFRDLHLTPKEEASYYVQKIDIFGKKGKPTYHINVKKSINTQPKIVKDIFLKNSDRQIILRWGKIDKILGYNVYRSTNYGGGFIKLNQKPIKKAVFFDRNFKLGQNYYYYITTINMQGESKASKKMLAYAKDATPPPFPLNLKASVKAGLVTLSWRGVKAKDLLGYKIYMSMDKTAKQWAMVTKEAISKTTFVHKRPKTLSRHVYYYRVSAVDKNFNESAPSNSVMIKLPDVTPPSQPIVTKFIVYPNKIVLDWNRIIVYDFDHYNLYRKKGKNIIKLNTKPLIRNHFIDTKPQKGINEYIITAVDKSGNESAKNQSQKINALDLKPVTITNVTVKKIKEGTKISFSCKDKDYKGFEVFRSSGSDKRYYNISNFQKGNSFTDKHLLGKRTYFYKLKAYDMMGNIRESDVVEVKIK
ncbi:hypothetical protein [Sulfurospirillum sp. 1612]|uniref:hypothetical protein n=1 Tax=Sulfurospirillum sp. 1612 TaxID=3094835 RepID=UPI002F94D328